ncbi:MAG: ComF family protein [Candidatus Levyibacteriota bacterium]
MDGSFSSLAYNPIAKKLIYRFKYKPFLLDLQSLLSELFYEGLIQNETLAKDLKNAILVPIPLHSSKLRSRGYNQAEILAKGLSERLGIPTLNLLRRVKNTKTQFSLGKKERTKNMKGAFRLNSEFIIHNSEFRKMTIFLVDDILTSGSTLSEAANVLKRAGAGKVFGLTLAREQ